MALYKVVLVDGHIIKGYDFNIEKEIFKDNNIEFLVENCVTESEIIEKCRDADGVLSVYANINRNVINNMHKCKVFVRYGIGYDNIDVEAATEKKIPVCNIPDFCIPEVATHTMALILAIERKLMIYDKSVKRGEWNKYQGFTMQRLSEQTLGLIGFGHIAREVAKYAAPFGFNIIAYDPFVPDEVFEETKVKRVELEELYKTSDVISLHIPLNEKTRNIINSKTIEKMKKDVIIVNTGRGPLICEKDLINALRGARIRAVGLDVLEEEPPSPNNELFQFENVVITPHVAFNSSKSVFEQRSKVAETTCRVLKGEKVFNIVNKEIYD